MHYPGPAAEVLLGRDGSENLVGFLVMKELKAEAVLVVRTARKAVIAGKIGEHVFDFLYHLVPFCDFCDRGHKLLGLKVYDFYPNGVLRPVLRIWETLVLISFPAWSLIIIISVSSST